VGSGCVVIGNSGLRRLLSVCFSTYHLYHRVRTFLTKEGGKTILLGSVVRILLAFRAKILSGGELLWEISATGPSRPVPVLLHTDIEDLNEVQSKGE
jgi:hypothetical protein